MISYTRFSLSNLYNIAAHLIKIFWKMNRNKTTKIYKFSSKETGLGL